MNDAIQKEVLHWLEGLRGTAEKVSNFAIEQAPYVVQEIVTYGRIWHGCCSILLFILLLVGFKFLHHAWNFEYGNIRDEDAKMGNYAARYGFGILWTCISFGIFLYQLHQYLLATFAPRLYIIYYLAEVVSKIQGHQ